MTDQLREVDCADWLPAAAAAAAAGYDYLDLVAGVDRDQGVEVVARIVRSAAPGTGGVRLLTRVADDGEPLSSLTSVYPAAAWHERELAEMFGVRLVGHPALRPLLRRQAEGAPPLRRSTVLAARVARPWPGAAEAGAERRGSRRRQAPPGAVTDWLDVDDAPDTRAATPVEERA